MLVAKVEREHYIFVYVALIKYKGKGWMGSKTRLLAGPYQPIFGNRDSSVPDCAVAL